jgi:hypothetical protein
MAFLILAMSTAVSQEIAAQGWTLLGSRTVNDRVDHDSITVTGVRGDFTGVKLAVGKMSPIRFYRVVVHFANGGSQELEMRDLIPAGGETRVMDLRGTERVIRNIDIWYEASSLGPRGAVIRVYGRR